MKESSACRAVQFGLIGAGAIAQAYGQAFAESDRAQLAAVADCRAAAAEAMAATFGCQAFSNSEAMLEDAEIDAVIVCTPPSTHREVCCAAMERGVHVLCEKPLAVSSAAAEEMIGMAEARELVFTMASKFRYVPDVAQAKALIAGGAIGEVVLFENVFTGRVDMTRRWNSDPRIAGGGVLIDNGTHSVDITRYCLGELAEVQAMEGNRIQFLPVEDTAKMFVRSRDGVLGSIDLSWSVSKELPYFIAVYGSSGTILVGWRESKLRRSGDEGWTVFGAGYNKLEAFRRQIDNFAGAVRGEESLVVTPEDALASVQVIEAAYRSLARHEWEPIGEPREELVG
ncbi:MAG: gfo/Idh/MocA family oxidoreductase [Planctomycetota bacterium]|nr:MAG: gfo/Idh/MocA family oxidoreductase [Planctomycetota bacterium]